MERDARLERRGRRVGDGARWRRSSGKGRGLLQRSRLLELETADRVAATTKSLSTPTSRALHQSRAVRPPTDSSWLVRL